MTKFNTGMSQKFEGTTFKYFWRFGFIIALAAFFGYVSVRHNFVWRSPGVYDQGELKSFLNTAVWT